MKRDGFTLIEVTVSIAIFTIIISVASLSFIQALRTQRHVGALIASMSNASLVLEQMSREIRTGSTYCYGVGPGQTGGGLADNDDPDTFRCNASIVAGSGIGGRTTKLVFVNADLDRVMYRLDGDQITRRVLDSSGNDSGPQALTASNVAVDYLLFDIENESYQPRVTISLGVRPKDPGVQAVVTALQTTISSRQQ